MSNRRKVTTLLLALTMFFLVTTAESCSTSVHKASQGLDALNANCSDALASEDSFAAAEADQANRSDQSLSETKAAAKASLEKHCTSSRNADYQPYVDVQLDISG